MHLNVIVAPVSTVQSKMYLYRYINVLRFSNLTHVTKPNISK